jgi:hypothetical protein
MCKQAVEAAEIDEHAVFGDVLDHAGDGLALFEGGQELAALAVALFFKQHAAGNDDVAAAAVDLQHAKFEILVDQGVHVRHRAQVDMGTGQECLDTLDFDNIAALDATHDTADDDIAGVEQFFQFIQDLHALGLFPGQDDGAFALILADNIYVDSVANFDSNLTVFHEFIQWNLAFGLEVDVHENVGFINLHDLARNDHSLFDVTEIGVEIVLELRLKIHLHVEIVHGLWRGLSVVHTFTP